MGDQDGSIGAATGQQVIDRFLAGRPASTARAYTADLEDFARFRGRPPAEAVVDLLAADLDESRRLVLGYAVHLRRQGRAQATIDRRFATLRSLSQTARDLGLAGWAVELPDEDWAAEDVESRSPSVPYVFPRHPTEVDRLDLQHYALREALGTNYQAPIGRPRRVLDVGSGTGQWAFDLCAEFSEAMVVGLDLVTSKPDRPAGYRLVRANVLQGLPFAGDVFDFVHQRFLTAGIPVAAWPPLMQEMARVARPGGWVELVEGAPMIEPAGPAITRLIELGRRLGSGLGLDTTGAIYGSLAEQLGAAGLTQVATRHVDLPIGEWGGRVGSFMASDLRAGFTRLTDVYRARFGLSAEECGELLTAMQVEWTELETTLRIGYAFGRKPY